jgi:glycosyltransferase involved in cell wall biosynthesis
VNQLEQQVSHASVVICTRNRADKIGTAVKSVLQLDDPSFDVTVIDQSTTDATEEVLRPLAADDTRLHYVHVDEAGLSRAYNNGVRRTSGDIIAFTDDDCVVDPDWLTHIRAAFAAEPDGDLLYGQVIPYGDDRMSVGLTPRLEIPEPQRLAKGEGFKVFGMGANFAARRRLFDAIGGFDEILGGGGPLRSAQDYDFAYRAYQGGRVILLRPEVTLRHDGRRELGDWPSLLLGYGVGDGAFYAKHVRCRDPFALWLLVRQLGTKTARWTAKKVLGRNPNNWNYIRGVVTGIRESFRFRVDRRTRLYREP